MPKPAFTEVEDFYIQGHLDADPKAVAKALGRPRAHAAVAKRAAELKAAAPPAKPRSLLHTKTGNGQEGRVVAMTAAASAAADRAAGRQAPKPKPGEEDGFAVTPPDAGRQAYLDRMKTCIHNPNAG